MAYEDAVETIELLLERDVRVGVVTSAGDIVRKQMLEVGIPLDQLVLLQTAADTPHHKPDPRVFAPAVKRLGACGVEPEATVYVGDSLNDHLAARGAGLGFLGVHGRTTERAEFERVGVRSVANLREIADVHASR